MMMTGRLWWTLAARDGDNGAVTVSKNNAQWTAAGQHLLNMSAGADGISPTSGVIGAAVKLVRK